MRALVGILAAGAVLASAAWTAAVPAPPVAEGSLSASTVPIARHWLEQRLAEQQVTVDQLVPGHASH